MKRWFLLLAAGCVDVDTSETTHELSTTLFYHSDESAPKDLGSAADRTCFLLGVEGPVTRHWYAKGWNEGYAGVAIENGRWVARVSAASLSYSVRIRAMCVPYAANRVVLTIAHGEVAHANVQPSRKCFLTSLRSRTFEGWNGHPWIAIAPEGNAWMLRANFIDTSSSEAPAHIGTASAVCVDIPSSEARWIDEVAPSGDASFAFPQFPDEGFACGLTRVQHDFDGQYGVDLERLRGEWTLQLARLAAGRALCVR